jgi:hypothetical protein
MELVRLITVIIIARRWSLLLAIPIQSTPFLFNLIYRETPDVPSLNLVSAFRCVGRSTIVLFEGLFVTAYSIYSQLPSVSGDRLLHPQSENTWKEANLTRK